MNRSTYVICTFMILAACAEATGGLSGDVDAGGTDGGSTGPSSDGGSSDAHANPPVDADVRASDLLINEISPSAEWVELVNASDRSIDLSFFKVADEVADAGTPKVDEAVSFPAGKVLSPNAYVIVHKAPKDAGACPVGTESYCFEAKFGISSKAGDKIFVLGPGDVELSSVALPPNAVASGKTWGRVPSGAVSGTFSETSPTPGAKNAP